MAHLDIDVAVRWTDLDAYGHVNNAAMVRLLEEGRIAAFWQPTDEEIALGAPDSPAALGSAGVGAEISTVVASQRIEYVSTLGHRREGVIVRLWVSRLGGASMDVDYLVLTKDDPDGAHPVTRARTVMVTIDAATGAPVRLGDEVRERLERYRDEPLTFRG